MSKYYAQLRLYGNIILFMLALPFAIAQQNTYVANYALSSISTYRIESMLIKAGIVNKNTKQSILMANPMPPKDLCPFAIEGTPPPSSCTLNLPGSSHGLVANGCDFVGGRKPDDPNINNPLINPGASFIRSVVSIETPEVTPSGRVIWKNDGTGSIIGNRWILTAAHFLDKNALLHVRPVYILPWNRNYNGVPVLFDDESGGFVKFLVKAIYIPKTYKKTFIDGYGETNVDDYALLELDAPIPNLPGPDGSWYQPLALKPDLPPEQTQVWSPGYGVDELNAGTQGSGVFHYRNIYYMSNYFYGRDVGYIYTLGTLPEATTLPDGTQKYAAWSFNGPGDSGGPLLYYDYGTHKFSILGIVGSTLFNCRWAGFFAPLPYSYTANTSIPAHFTQIRDIISNDSVPLSEFNCIASVPGGCKPEYLYVLHMSNNAVVSFKFTSSLIEYVNKASTGYSPTSMAIDNSGKFLYTTNSVSNSISMFQLDYYGNIIHRSTLSAGGSEPVKIEFSPTGNAYVLYKSDHKITGFKVDPGTGVLVGRITSVILEGSPSAIAFASINGANFAYVTDIEKGKIYVYGISSKGELIKVQEILSQTEQSLVQPINIEIDSENKFAYVLNMQSSTVSVFKILLNGRLDRITEVPSDGLGPTYMTLVGNFAYVANSRTGNITKYKRDLVTGNLIYDSSFFINKPNDRINTMTANPGKSILFVNITSEGQSYIAEYVIYKDTGDLTRSSFEKALLGFIAAIFGK
jgi:6-phosphogluconolactonase (cycloisomerase 2 family)